MIVNKTSMKPVSWREGNTQSGQPLDTFLLMGDKELRIKPTNSAEAQHNIRN